jgi:hypothetical protein
MIDSLQALKTAIEYSGDTIPDNDRFAETLWQHINNVKTDAEAAALISNPRFPALAQFFKLFWADYFSRKERFFASSILQEKTQSDSDKRGRHAIRFAALCPPASINAYRAVYDGDTIEQDFVPFKKRQGTFTIIGCGAYPTTFISFYKQPSSYSSFAAIDSCRDSLQLGKKVFSLYADACPHEKVVFQCTKAEEFDYSNTQVLLITLGLFNKKAVLQRVAAELPAESIIILRNPILLGNLVYEDVLADLPLFGFNILANTAITTHCMSFVLKKT